MWVNCNLEKFAFHICLWVRNEKKKMSSECGRRCMWTAWSSIGHWGKARRCLTWRCCFWLKAFGDRNPKLLKCFASDHTSHIAVNERTFYVFVMSVYSLLIYLLRDWLSVTWQSLNGYCFHAAEYRWKKKFHEIFMYIHWKPNHVLINENRAFEKFIVRRHFHMGSVRVFRICYRMLAVWWLSIETFWYDSIGQEIKI